MPRPFLAISRLSITVITINWNVLTRKLRADTLGCAHIDTDFKSMTKKSPQTHTHTHRDARTDSGCTHWHLRMPIITSSAHQSQVLVRCMPFDHRLRRVHTSSATHACSPSYNITYMTQQGI